MANKTRVPMQVSPNFEKRIKGLQEKIMKKQGKNISLRELTEKISKAKDFDKLEEAILRGNNIEIKLNLDIRGVRR